MEQNSVCLCSRLHHNFSLIVGQEAFGGSDFLKVYEATKSRSKQKGWTEHQHRWHVDVKVNLQAALNCSVIAVESFFCISPQYCIRAGSGTVSTQQPGEVGTNSVLQNRWRRGRGHLCQWGKRLSWDLNDQRFRRSHISFTTWSRIVFLLSCAASLLH